MQRGAIEGRWRSYGTAMKLATALLLSALCGPSAGQLRVRAWAGTELVVQSLEKTQLGRRTIPANTTLGSYTVLTSTTGEAGGELRVGCHWSASGADLHVQEFGGAGTFMNPATRAAATGPHDVAFTLRSSKPAWARITIVASSKGQTMNGPAFWDYLALLLANGAPILSLHGQDSKRVEVPVLLTQSPLDLRVRSSGVAASSHIASAGYEGLIQIYVAPLRRSCTISPYGVGCAGSGIFSASETLLGNVQLAAGPLFTPPNTPGLLLLGSKRISVPIPGTQCLLLTDPLIVIPFRTDASGSFRLVLSRSGPVTFNVQSALLRTTGIASFLAMNVSCQ